MISLINRFCVDERGATATEYAMLIVFVALAIAVGAQAFGASVNVLFNKMAGSLTAITPPAPPAP
jgi:Flp pilus assembly pilin Flp